VALVGLQAAQQKMNVCIGSTSARACDSVGLPAETVIYPDAPGIDEWARCVLEGLQKLGKMPAVVA
jgi:uroporphyrinogen-III synthase